MLCCGRFKPQTLGEVSPCWSNAKDHHATLFYLQVDFIPSPSDPHHLLILLKDVRKIVRDWEQGRRSNTCTVS